MVGSEDWKTAQFITRNNNNFQPVTEKVLRVGGGYISTERENAEAEAKERLFNQKFSELLRKIVN